MLTIFWLVLVAIMLVIEIFTLGLTTIWFSLGGVAAAIAAGLNSLCGYRLFCLPACRLWLWF